MAGAEQERWHFTLGLFLTQQEVAVCTASLLEYIRHMEHFFLDLMLTQGPVQSNTLPNS